MKVEEKRPERVKRTSQAVRTVLVGRRREGKRRGIREEKERRMVEEAVPRTV